jgi:hypothetical protein
MVTYRKGVVMKRLFLASFAIAALAASADAAWVFKSVTSSYTLHQYSGTRSYVFEGSQGTHTDWHQLGIEVGYEGNNGASDLQVAGLQAHMYYTFKWTGLSPGSTVSGTFYKYRRHNCANWIYGATPAVSGYATYTEGSITDNWRGYWQTDWLSCTLNGQQTYNQAAGNYLNYPYGEHYPYWDSITFSTSVFWSSADSAYEATFDINLSGDDTVDCLAIDLDVSTGLSSALGEANVLSALTMEPSSVGSTSFTTDDPFGGSEG